MLGIPVKIFYVAGILATVYHLANGIWTSLITWGITIGPSSQRIAGYACSVFGVVLGIVGLSSLRGFGNIHDETVAAAADPGRPMTMSTQSNHPG